MTSYNSGKVSTEISNLVKKSNSLKKFNTFEKFSNATFYLLASVVWLSALLFGLYILTFYVDAFSQNQMETWNKNLPGLYQPGKALATGGIGLHFAAGGIILILGSIQLVSGIRKNFPQLHHWIGRIYLSACILTAIGGLVFILINGTIGGIVMDIGFSVYGILMLVCAINAFLNARQRNFIQHKAWAIRLYALAIGSWLYRMDYGFWLLLADGVGHNSSFQGPFDYVMDFFFYIPNLIVAEIVIRRKAKTQSGIKHLIFGCILLTASGFIGLGTYYFTLYYWGPSILGWLGFA